MKKLAASEGELLEAAAASEHARKKQWRSARKRASPSSRWSKPKGRSGDLPKIE
jgi:hypothetical protein